MELVEYGRFGAAIPAFRKLHAGYNGKLFDAKNIFQGS